MAAIEIDLRPEIVNISLYEDDAWACEVTINQPGTTTPLDLTGATIAATLRPSDGSADEALVITAGDLAAGQFYYGQAGATKTGKYDVQVTLGGAPRTYVRGKLAVTADITE